MSKRTRNEIDHYPDEIIEIENKASLNDSPRSIRQLQIMKPIDRKAYYSIVTLLMVIFTLYIYIIYYDFKNI